MGALPDTKNRRRIYLMRHGHVNYFAQPEDGSELDTKQVPLTKRGQRQADAAGEALSGVQFDVAISSGYPRTRETAERVLAANNGPVPLLETEPRLVEIHAGTMSHAIMSRESLTHAMERLFGDAPQPETTFGEGGEAFGDVMHRCRDAISDLLARDDWTTALIAAHEGVNRVLLSSIATGGLSAMGAFEQDTACINIIDVDQEPDGLNTRMILKAVNVTGDNPGKRGMHRTSLEEIFQPYEE